MKKPLEIIKRLSKSALPNNPAKLEDHCRLYCIGDIHGRCDLLQQLHRLIVNDATNYQDNIIVVYLGDYVDRGPHSKEVIDYLLTNPLPNFKNVFLLGNHEQVLLEFLLDSNMDKAVGWLSFGGLSTLVSYGVKIMGIPHLGQLPDLKLEFQDKIPKTHVDFFQRLLPYYEKDDYFFVHAGIRPRLKLQHQILDDMLWIRDKFLDSQRFHGKIIVHGHSVTEAPVVRPNRIGIDTGAYNSGILTCLVLENTEKRFLSTVINA